MLDIWNREWSYKFAPSYGPINKEEYPFVCNTEVHQVHIKDADEVEGK